MSNKTSKKKASSEQAATEQAPLATLLSSISYEKREDYENFLANLTPEHAILVLVSAANHAQMRGAFNLEEAELVAKSIKRLSQKPEQPAEASAEQPEKTEA